MSRSALILPAVLGLAILTTGFVSRPPGAVGQAMVPPICDAGGPYSGYLGHPIEFDGTGSTDPDGAIVSYEWDFGDGSSGTGPTPSHNYTVCCDFTVTLTVTDDTQLSSTCVNPRIAFKGVRSSWLSPARNAARSRSMNEACWRSAR